EQGNASAVANPVYLVDRKHEITRIVPLREGLRLVENHLGKANDVNVFGADGRRNLASVDAVARVERNVPRRAGIGRVEGRPRLHGVGIIARVGAHTVRVDEVEGRRDLPASAEGARDVVEAVVVEL